MHLEVERCHNELYEVNLRKGKGGGVSVHQRGHWQPESGLLITLAEKLLGDFFSPPAKFPGCQLY